MISRWVAAAGLLCCALALTACGSDEPADTRDPSATPEWPDPLPAYGPDFTDVVAPVYSPDLDGDADPGEVVWTWVPYEDDPLQGKDRPVLVVGHDGPWVLGLMLTSKDHDRDAADEARFGRYWMDLGSGDWDSQGRDSEVRLDRILRVNPDEIRREGAVLDRERFDAVVGSLPAANDW